MTNILAFESIHILNPLSRYYLAVVKKLLNQEVHTKTRLVLYRLDKDNTLIRDKRNLSGTSIGLHAADVDTLSIKFYRHLEKSKSCDAIQIKNKKLYTSILNNRIELLNKNEINLIVQDARDYHAISKVYGDIDPDIIIHLAAVSHANKSNKDPHSTFDHSFRTLENTLDFSKNKKIHVIYLSSSMVYGNFDSKDVNEETPCKPIGIYGTLKFSGELLVKAYNQVFDLPYSIIRPSALYGERCVSRRVGQIFIENALLGKDIAIDGDGLEKLDFTYIQDLVSGVKSILENEKSKNNDATKQSDNKRETSKEFIEKALGKYKKLKKSFMDK